MQWKWNAWLQTPQATVHSSLVALAWFAWHSIQRSMMWLRQIAQLSTTMSQAQRETAFHFLISKRLGFLEEDEEAGALLDGSETGTMGTSESKVAILSSPTLLLSDFWFFYSLEIIIKRIRIVILLGEEEFGSGWVGSGRIRHLVVFGTCRRRRNSGGNL